jgi:hypothetical protein
MAFNPSPKVAAARDYANKFGENMVVIVAISGHQFEVISFGQTKDLCGRAKKYADKIHDCMSGKHE